MATIELRSYQQIAGSMIAKLLAETDLTDLSPGSVFMTTIEAAASSDLLSEAKLLQLLKIRNVDRAQGVDLENLADELGVTPNREGADSASVLLQFSDSSFTKLSSLIFAGAVSPTAGDTSMKVISALGWAASGTIYIGRGTASSEAISYVSLVNSGSYWLVNLASPLTKDHLVGEEVVVGQGGDRTIPAQTVCRVPPSAGNAAIEFSTLTDAILLDGEDTLPNISAVAVAPGSSGNVSINKIVDFSSVPFATAKVDNLFPGSGGSDIETDPQLRQRIKSHVHNLSKGTETAIRDAVVGVSDPDEQKRVVSAFLREPTSVGALGILFIDDGTGFAPSFSGIGEEVIVTSAAGTEVYLQLQQFPLVKAQTVSVGQEPFNLVGGEKLFFEVDNESEENSLPASSYGTPGVATAQEIAEAINKNFTTVEARAKSGRLYVTPVSDDPEYIRVGIATNDANTAIRFPIRKQYTLRLYQNDIALEKNGLEAILQSILPTQWPTFGSSETLQLTIDGIASPLVTFTDLDFQTYSSSNTINGATAPDWVKVFGKKFIGITAASKDDGSFTLTSNQGKTNTASLATLGGSLVGKIFAVNSSSVGATPQYKLNRLLGQIELSNRLVLGDGLKAGTVNTAGFVNTLKQTTFDLSTVLGSAAKMVIITEASAIILAFDQIASTLTFSVQSPSLQRIAGTVLNQFENLNVDDWVYLYNMPVNGLYRIENVDTTNYQYIDVFCPDPVAGSILPDGNNTQIFFFRSTGMPQEITLPTGVSVSNTAVATAINDQLSGGIATVEDNDSINIKTLRFDGSGALAIPVIAGSSKNLGITAGTFLSNDPHIASMESGDLMGFSEGKFTPSVSDLISPFDTFTVTGTPFTEARFQNRPLLHYLGAAARIIRQTQERTASNTLQLRDDVLPQETIGLGPDMRAVTGSGVEFGESDNMVFIVDDDAAKKTFNIPMYVKGTVAAPSVPNSTQFDAIDAASDNLGTSLRWQGYRFADYRAWFQAKNDLPASVANSQIHLNSQLYGPNGENILVGLFYPNLPLTAAEASFSIDYANADVLIDVQLASGAERITGVSTNDEIEVKVTGPVLGFYQYDITFPTPDTLGTTVPGDIISLNDEAFSAANQGPMKITAVSNLLDASLSYQFVQETSTSNTVTSGNTVDFALPPGQALEIGDKITTVSIRKNTTAQTTNTITVPTGGAFTAGGGSFTINNVPFNYTAYNTGTGDFTGVTPDPTILVLVGQELKQLVTPTTQFVTTVNTPTEVITGGSFPDGDGYELTITHAALTASAAPSFTAAVDDYVQVIGAAMIITGIVSPTIFHVDTPFSFTGFLPGNISRIRATAQKVTNGVNETVTLTSAQGVRVFALDGGSNTATAIEAVINNTAGVQDLIFASDVVGSNGSGQIATSTTDELANGNTSIRLQNGESFVLSSQNANPSFTLKEPLAVAPSIGETVLFIPMTPQNVADHFNKKQISGLSIAANINLVNEARHVQVSSLIPGGSGQIYAVGGKASGNNVFDLRNSALDISNSIGAVEVDHSVMDFVAPGYTVKLYQAGRAKKNAITSILNTTTAQIQIAGLNTALLSLSVPIAAVQSYTHTGSVIWSVRKLSRNRVRYDLLSGTATLPATLQSDDWVFVGNGSSYAGITPPQLFASANKGYFQIVETDAATYFDVDNINGAEEFITASSAPFIFIPYHSVMIGDQVSIDVSSPFSTNNRGTFVITDVPDLYSVKYVNTTVSNEGPTALGINGTNSIAFLDQGFMTYRKVLSVSPNPTNPTNRAIIVVEPGYNISLLNEGQGAKITFPTRLGFGVDPVPGISGYQYWTGLKRRVQRTLDGYEPDSTTFPGVRAAGVAIEAREPQIQRVALNMIVKTKEGVALASIADNIRSGVVGFINSLGLGLSVVLSEIVSIVQSTAGVDSVVLVSPTLDKERIVILDNAIARISPTDVTLS